jgi:hypothetical protein
MSRIRALNINQLNEGLAWINKNLTQFCNADNADYWYSKCLDKLGGLMSLHVRSSTGQKHWFRARLEKTFEHGSECVTNSYLHPPSKITRPGRANIAGHPVLYVSDSLDDCLQEIGCVSPGDTSRVAVIGYNGNVELAQFLFPNYIDQLGNRPAVLASQFFNPFNKIMSGYSTQQQEWAFHLHRLICAQYLSNNHYFSSLVSWKLIYKNSGIDGIIYPSTYSLQTVNFALSSIISSQCKVLRCLMVRIADDGNTQIIGVGMVEEQSAVKWKDPTEENLDLSCYNIVLKHDKSYTKTRKKIGNIQAAPPPPVL